MSRTGMGYVWENSGWEEVEEGSSRLFEMQGKVEGLDDAGGGFAERQMGKN